MDGAHPTAARPAAWHPGRTGSGYPGRTGSGHPGRTGSGHPAYAPRADGRSWTGGQKAAAGIAVSAAALVATLIGIGVGGTTGSGQAAGSAAAAASSAAPSSDAGSPSSNVGSAQPSSDAGAEPSSSAGGSDCTSHACIVQEAEQWEVGQQAKDGSVVTKAVCYESTVTANAGDTYTVSCDLTYTDGTVWAGLVTILEASNQVSWQPESEVS